MKLPECEMLTPLSPARPTKLLTLNHCFPLSGSNVILWGEEILPKDQFIPSKKQGGYEQKEALSRLEGCPGGARDEL